MSTRRAGSSSSTCAGSAGEGTLNTGIVSCVKVVARPAAQTLSWCAWITFKALTGSSAGLAVGRTATGHHIEAKEAINTYLRVSLGAVEAAPVASSDHVRANDSVDKGNTIVSNRFVAVGTIETVFAPQLAVVTGACGSVEEVALGTTCASNYTAISSTNLTSFALRSVGAYFAGVSAQVVEIRKAGSANSLATASCAASNAFNAYVVGESPACLASRACTSSRTRAYSASRVITEEAAVVAC